MKKATKKLSLNRETVRQLHRYAFGHVNAGAAGYSYTRCYTVCITECC